MENQLLKIKNIVEELLRVMDFSGEVTVDNQDENFLRANIQSTEAAYLIGRSGENLKALQHLSRVIINKGLAAPVRLIIDVNNYQSNHIELLKEMALNLAKEVVQARESRWLEPMNAYERRIVHLALAGQPGIRTESEGDEEERRVVIKPVNN